MNLDESVLIADGEGVLFFLIVILFTVIGGLTQLFKKLQEGQQDPRRPRPGPRPAHRPGGVRPGGARANVPPGRDPVRDEVQQFLREAADRRGGPRPQQARRVGPPPAERPIVLEEVPEPDSVAEHVRQQVPGQRFGDLSSDVGEHLARTGEVVEEHVHKVFDHRVGRLEGTPGESAYAAQAEEAESPEDRIDALPQTAAAGLAAMLAEPTSLRRAILLSEILQRPEHRWR